MGEKWPSLQKILGVVDSSVVHSLLLQFLSHLSFLLTLTSLFVNFSLLSAFIGTITNSPRSTRPNSGSALQPLVRRDGNYSSLRLQSGAPRQVRIGHSSCQARAVTNGGSLAIAEAPAGTWASP